MNHDLAASEFLLVLSNPALRVIAAELYHNQSGRPGMRWNAVLDGHHYFVSESRTTVPSTPVALACVLRRADLDRSKDVHYYAHKRYGTGIRIEFWYRRRWYQIWSPED